MLAALWYVPGWPAAGLPPPLHAPGTGSEANGSPRRVASVVIGGHWLPEQVPPGTSDVPFAEYWMLPFAVIAVQPPTSAALMAACPFTTTVVLPDTPMPVAVPPEHVLLPSARSGEPAALPEPGCVWSFGRTVAVSVNEYGPGVVLTGSLVSVTTSSTVWGSAGQVELPSHVTLGADATRVASVAVSMTDPSAHVRRESSRGRSVVHVVGDARDVGVDRGGRVAARPLAPLEAGDETGRGAASTGVAGRHAERCVGGPERGVHAAGRLRVGRPEPGGDLRVVRLVDPLGRVGVGVVGGEERGDECAGDHGEQRERDHQLDQCVSGLGASGASSHRATVHDWMYVFVIAGVSASTAS